MTILMSMIATIKNNELYRDEVIRAEMAAQRLKIEDLATKTGLHRHTVRNICSGAQKDIKLSSLSAIADGLGLHLSDLLRSRAA